MGFGLTNIQYIAPAARVQMQWGVARRAVLGFELPDELVETCLVGHVSTRELQYPLAAESVLQRLLADGALAPYEGALTA
jgi:hypothetical protein